MVSNEFPDSAVMCSQPANPVEETDFTGMDERQAGVDLDGMKGREKGLAAAIALAYRALYLHTGIFLRQSEGISRVSRES